MSGLERYSSAELLAEIDRRKTADSPPPPVDKPDFGQLIATVTDGVAHMVKGKFEDEDFRAYVYEAALSAIYGEAFWAWRRRQRF